MPTAPTAAAIAEAAYHRWQARGATPGEDQDDWLAAERGLWFAGHYELAARYGLDGRQALIGRVERRVCRFCEQAAPRTRFTDPAPAWPECLGPGPIALDQCDDCRALSRVALEVPLAGFLAGLPALGPLAEGLGLPVAAAKALLRAALAVLPEDDLEGVPDALEWVNHPDHRLDRRFAPPPTLLHRGPGLPATAWAAVARRLDDEAPVPHLVAWLGGPGYVFQWPLPLCARDEEFAGHLGAVPPLPRPDDPTGWHGPIDTAELPLAAEPAVAVRRRLPLSRAS